MSVIFVLLGFVKLQSRLKLVSGLNLDHIFTGMMSMNAFGNASCAGCTMARNIA